MKLQFRKSSPVLAIFSILLITVLSACEKDDLRVKDETGEARPGSPLQSLSPGAVTEAILLAIDEESIDNGNPPNSFSNVDVNDQLARVGLRETLRYFRNNVGKTIDLFTGEVGDEGWHALKTIPSAWKNAGPTTNGSRNYLQAGRGLGGGEDNKEVLLDKIPDVTPLRATGLKMLIGKTVLAVVYDGDVSINYGPLNGNLMGANLGIVALQVTKVTRRYDGSSGSLPRVTVKIISVDAAKGAPLKLFSNAPVPRSSSEPFDIAPPATAPVIKLTNAP